MISFKQVGLYLAVVGLTACASNPYQKTTDLQFQKKSENRNQVIEVIRDANLCSGDHADQQDCPISFYIDNIKSGTFYVNNSAQFNLMSERYNLKVKNCTDQCFSCETEIDLKDDSARQFLLTVNEKGQPLILNANQQSLCKVESKPLQAKTIAVNLSADTLFVFDGGADQDLLAAGRQKILDVTDKIKNQFVTVSHISLVGHTDRLGGERYNQNLAQKRAETVRNILVENGISKEIISVSSQGEHQPVTNGCTDVAAGPAQKACLQADRRVTVEITGVAQ